MSSIPRPQGHHVLTPSAVVPETAAVISFLEQAFSGQVVDRYDGPDGVVHHAEVRVGDSVLMLGSPSPTMPVMPAGLSFYVDNAEQVDQTYNRAIEAGAQTMAEPQTQPWGYRSACVRDVGGNRWTICTIVEQLTHDEIMSRMQEMS